MDGVGAVSSRVWTIPNVLSFFRLALVPVFLAFVIEGEDALALLVLVVSSVTDFLDGWLARRLNQVSRLGQLLDPAADRLYIFAALVGLAWREVIPWWLVAVIVARDVMLAVLGVILANHGFGPLPVHHLHERPRRPRHDPLHEIPSVADQKAGTIVHAGRLPRGWAAVGGPLP